MRIGIDAKWYFEGPPSGKRVIRSLVDHMLSIDDQNEYVIFLNKKHQSEKFLVKDPNRIKVCYVWAGNNALSNIFVVPFFSKRYKVDVTLYQTFISPFDSAEKIAYIHDVLFLSNPEFYTLYERLYFLPLKFLTRWANRIVTVSQEEKKRLQAFGYALENKISVAYHGVEPEFTSLEHHPHEEIERVKQQFNLPDRFILSLVEGYTIAKRQKHTTRYSRCG
jgi:hypothetical protein